MCADLQSSSSVAHEGYVPVDNGALYYREIGHGWPIIILHGGPDFDHNYLLPEMDQLASSFRLIYYDQRGRGKSADNVHPEAVSIESEIADMDAVRKHFQLESVAILGHSFGGLLALEYAVRHPERVFRLILMNSAPASHDDYQLFRETRGQQAPGDVERMRLLAATDNFAVGDIETEAEYYRIHYGTTLRQPEHRERLIKSLRLNFTRDDILKARAIEERLMNDTWRLGNYNLLPKLERLDIPTLIIHGDYDFVPIECTQHIARAIAGSRLVVLKDCGHFCYLEYPDAVYYHISAFFLGK